MFLIALIIKNDMTPFCEVSGSHFKKGIKDAGNNKETARTVHDRRF